MFDLLPEGAARSAPGARFAEIWAHLVDWGPVTFIVHTEDGVFETKAPLPPGSEGHGYFNIHGESPLGGHLRIARCAAIYFAIDRSLAAGPARCNSSISTAARCSRSLSCETKSASCFQTSYRASSGCGKPRLRLKSRQRAVARSAPAAEQIYLHGAAAERRRLSFLELSSTWTGTPGRSRAGLRPHTPLQRELREHSWSRTRISTPTDRPPTFPTSPTPSIRFPRRHRYLASSFFATPSIPAMTTPCARITRVPMPRTRSISAS